MRPKDRFFITVALIYSPDRDLTSDAFWNHRELKPLSGVAHQIIMSNIIDIVHLRGPNTAEAPTKVINLFSGTVTKQSASFFESLVSNSQLSNSYCGTIISPGHQNWWRQTTPTKGM